MLYEFEGKKPVIGKGCYICPSATIIGDVTLGENCYIGPGARLRGDYGTIILGAHSAVEDMWSSMPDPGKRPSSGSM